MKKIITLSLALILALSLAACSFEFGGGTSDSDPPKSKRPSGNSTNSPGDTSDPSQPPDTSKPSSGNTATKLIGHWCLSSFPQSHQASYYSEASIETMYKEHNNTFIEFKADGTYFLFHASVTAFTGSAIEKGNYSVNGNLIHFTNITGISIWNYDKPDTFETYEINNYQVPFSFILKTPSEVVETEWLKIDFGVDSGGVESGSQEYCKHYK